jgi:hypothetical protein
MLRDTPPAYRWIDPTFYNQLWWLFWIIYKGPRHNNLILEWVTQWSTYGRMYVFFVGYPYYFVGFSAYFWGRMEWGR